MTTPAPLTIAEFQALIHRRYFPTDSARGWAGTFAYFIEEVGELATALAANNRPQTPPTDEEKANLAEEFADVLAWMATLANISGVDIAQACEKYTDESRVAGVKE